MTHTLRAIRFGAATDPHYVDGEAIPYLVFPANFPRRSRRQPFRRSSHRDGAEAWPPAKQAWRQSSPIRGAARTSISEVSLAHCAGALGGT
jgi:hypothetical protein